MGDNKPTWSLPVLLSGLQSEMQQKLTTARQVFVHPGTKGDASENVWLELLQGYLPQRYQAIKAHVVDSEGAFSEQIDIVIYDRQYSPFIFTFQGQNVIPAESVYAIFEAKQSINANLVEYAQKKVASVRKLYRTSLPIPHAGGTYKAKALSPIIGGILTLESEWNPALGASLRSALLGADQYGYLDVGCVAAHGTFTRKSDSGGSIEYEVSQNKMPVAAFLLELISQLQGMATVPMIDIKAYAKWIDAD